MLTLMIAAAFTPLIGPYCSEHVDKFNFIFIIRSLFYLRKNNNNKDAEEIYNYVDLFSEILNIRNLNLIYDFYIFNK